MKVLICCLIAPVNESFIEEVDEKDMTCLELIDGCEEESLGDCEAQQAAWTYVMHKLGKSNFYLTEEELERERDDLPGGKDLKWSDYRSWTNATWGNNCHEAERFYLVHFS